MFDIEEIKQRMLNKQPTTDAEKAAVVANDPHALAAFMIGNNPGNLNFQLRRMGYNHLSFTPSREQLMRQMNILIDQNNVATLDDLAKNYEVLADNLSPQFIAELKNQISK